MSTTVSDWTATAERPPSVGLEVATMDSGGHVQTLVFKNGLWWFPDFSMYVYYTPTFWKAI